MEKKAAIVIHVYKETLTLHEKISLTQLRKVLGKYPVILTAPEGFCANAYREILHDQLHSVIGYPQRFFNGLTGYNKLMLSKDYYKALLEYEYILLHHTDAFVFKNELDSWMDKGYDYIGAPIYDYDGTMNPTHYRCVGNGGFSLRKVASFYALADSKKVIYKAVDIINNFKKYNWRGRIARLPYYLGLLTTFQATLNSKREGVRENEDVIWGHYVPRYVSSFSVATFDEALQFGMEFNCDQLLKKNNGHLPFGCHGWYREIFIGFWSPYITAAGYTLSDGE